MIKRTVYLVIALAAFAGLLAVLPPGASASAFPASNGKIVFTRGGQIFAANADGSGATNIANGDHAAVSPNGQLVAYDRAGQIYTIGTTGGAPAEAPVPLAAGSNPAWSAGGGTIVYQAAGEIWRIPYPNVATSPTNLTNSAGVDQDPTVSPSGSEIAFASDRTGSMQIYVMNATDGSGQHAVSSGGASVNVSPTWSPSGTTIVFVSSRDGNQELYTTGPSSPADRRLTTTVGTNEVDPAYSPDGTTILYSAGGNLETIPAAGGSATTVTSAGTDTAPDWQDAPPANTSAPTITPTVTPAQGDTLFASTGTWTGSPTSYAYQWQRCDSAVSTCAPSDAASDPDWTSIGSSSSYTVQAAEVGATKNVRVLVTATNIAGASTPASSAFAGHANGVEPVNISPPTISGTPNADNGFLFASPGTWTGATPITYTYQWLRCGPAGDRNGKCTPIPGATSSFYSVSGDDISYQLNVAVLAKNSAGTGGASSAATEYVSGTPPRNHVSPTISGGIEIGSTLTTTDGIWTGAQPFTFTYQWRICKPDGSDCNTIPGATGKSYTIQPGDYGSTIRMMIRARNGAGFAYGISNHTFPILHKTLFGPAVSQPPTIAGSTRAGELLTASAGTWTGESPITFAYAWQRCDATGSGCKPIRGAAKATYRLATADIGSTIRVAVTATNTVNKAMVSADATDAVSAQRAHRKGRRIVGKKSQTVLVGTPNDDTIYAGSGNVTIYGMGGFDAIYAGSGNDVIYLGTGGSSRVWGGPGSNTIYAANGERDTILCGKGPSRVFADVFDVVKKCTVVTTDSPSGPAAPTASSTTP